MPKEIELTNTGRAEQSMRDADGNNVVIRPGETKKVNLEEKFADRMQQSAEAPGATLVVGKPKQGSQQEQKSEQKPEQKAESKK